MAQAQISQRVEIQEFVPRRHGEILAEWLGRPHVVRWWGDQSTELKTFLRRAPDTHAVILADNTPVGYLCWEPLSTKDRDSAGLIDLPDGVIDIDILIGEPQFVGREIGPRALRLLTDQLRRDVEARRAGLGISRSNRAALSAAEKAGFVPVRDFVDPVYGFCRYFIVNLRQTP